MSDLRDWIDGLKYKPGWKFSYDEGPGDWPVLRITAAVLHSETLEPVTFDIARFIPEFAVDDAGLFVKWVKTVLAEAEIHEMREFLRFYGHLVDSPHAVTPVDDESRVRAALRDKEENIASLTRPADPVAHTGCGCIPYIPPVKPPLKPGDRFYHVPSNGGDHP